MSRNARNTDPETSHEAADRLDEITAGECLKVIAYLQDGHDGAIPAEVDEVIKDGHKRMSDMLGTGVLRRGEKRLNPKTNRNGFTHWLAPASIIDEVNRNMPNPCENYIPNADRTATPAWVQCERSDEHERPFDCVNERGKAPVRPKPMLVLKPPKTAFEQALAIALEADEPKPPGCAHETVEEERHEDGSLSRACVDCGEILSGPWDGGEPADGLSPFVVHVDPGVADESYAAVVVTDTRSGENWLATDEGQEPAEPTEGARDDYRTPPLLYGNIAHRFGGFTLDAAATEESALANEYLSGPHGKAICAKEPCGLCADWGTNVVWCNPPYSRLGTWVAKCADAARKGATVVLLGLPFNGDDWMRTVQGTATAVWFLLPRVQFIPAPGVKVSSNQRGAMVTLWMPGAAPQDGPDYRLYDWKRDDFLGDEACTLEETVDIARDLPWPPDAEVDEWVTEKNVLHSRSVLKDLIREVLAEAASEDIVALVDGPLRVVRERMLTPEEDAKYEAVRARVELEFPLVEEDFPLASFDD